MADEEGIVNMEEVFRAAGQDAMDEKSSRYFLKDRGMSDEDIEESEKGKSDITLFTGPHLGGFNRPISLPETIECISTLSSLGMVGRFWKETKTQN